jgi:hypothetical protein
MTPAVALTAALPPVVSGHPAIELTGGGVADVVAGGSREFPQSDRIRPCRHRLGTYCVGCPRGRHFGWHDGFHVILEQHVVDGPTAGPLLISATVPRYGRTEPFGSTTLTILVPVENDQVPVVSPVDFVT